MSAALVRPFGIYGVPLTPADCANLEACYCSREIVESAGIRRVDSDEGREVVGRHDSADYSGLLFQYRWPGAASPSSHRLRLDNPAYQIKAGVKVAKQKYLSAPGYGNNLYFHPATPPAALNDPSVPLCIVEGEKKTLATFRLAREAAEAPDEIPFIPVGLAGVWSWRDSRQKTNNARGQRVSISAPIAALNRIEWTDRKIYILFDSNVSTNQSVAAARLELARELASRGAEVWLIDLPPEDGINGIDDFLARHGSGPALKLFEVARLFDPKEKIAKFAYTDYGNEQAFETLYGNEYLYNRDTEQWYRWNGFWEPDVMGSVDRAMLEVAAERLFATAILSGDQDSDEGKTKKRAIAGALKLQNVHGRQSALTSATSNPRFARVTSDFNQNDFLFGCAEGVIDLHTQEFRAGRREDMLSQRTDVLWGREADFDAWRRFLEDLFPGRPEMVRFLQCAIGYCLTGLTREEVFFILWGVGRNGKGTFLRILLAVFGDYSANTEFSTLIATRDGHKGPRNDIAALVGKRFVTAQESKEGAQLDEALIKNLTGGDMVTARFLHREFFTFRPTWKIWLATNHKPEIRGIDSGIWSRPKLIPFTQSFAGRENRGLKDFLLRPAQLSGVLRWAVEGCRMYLERGLEYPDEVLEATAAYRSESDLAARFVAERCERGEFFRVRARVLYQAFHKWAEGTDGLSETAFGLRIAASGFAKEHKNSGTVYIGLRLSGDQSDDSAREQVTGSD